MKKFISFLVFSFLSFSITFPVFAISSLPPTITREDQESASIVYPAGEDFVQLKKLIEANFSPKVGYQYNCISNGTLCPNYKYTSIIEKAIKFIVLKTYTGNEAFYDTLFTNANSYRAITQKNAIKNVLDMIPRGTAFADWKNFSFGSSIGGELLDASFGINFSENSNSNSLLGAIDNKIKEFKRNKCQRENTGNDSYTICPWSGETSNKYLPTYEELLKENIYLNGFSVKLESMKDEFEYTVSVAESSSSPVPQDSQKVTTESILALIPKESIYYHSIKTKLIQIQLLTDSDEKSKLVREILLLTENDSLVALSSKMEIKSQLQILVSKKQNDVVVTGPVAESYVLNYKKETYTLEEAKQEIEKKAITVDPVFTASRGGLTSLPCMAGSVSTLARGECTTANAIRRDVSTALGAYYSDKEEYPDSIDLLNPNYVSDSEMLPNFKKNFTYKNLPSTSSSVSPDFEITYIGHIGEGTSGTGEIEGKKDYAVLMSGATVPEIPAIFSHIPSDSMVLYVKNPQNLFDLLNQKSNTSQRLSGIDVSEDIKAVMLHFLELQNFDQIEKNLTHEMAIAVDNLDATAPDIILIISETDRAALSPSAKARVVGSQGGFIFIANSKASLERFTTLDATKSLRDASDFHYVWWKKSALIQDAFVFVGDAFFEKMLTFETYITHYRKYQDYTRLSMLQDLVWAYSDAFGSSPKSLSDLATIGLTTLTPDVLKNYTLPDGLVSHKNIGNLKSIKTLSEAQYDLSQISKKEIEDYKYNVLNYRDIWRSSLDPMGIVLNRYGDGIELDFFMTPIPASPDRDIQEMKKLFEGVTKDSLSFVTNPHIRSGLLSFVVGFDPVKLEQKIKGDANIASGFESFNKEILDGKNIFDYLGGEFAWSIGSLDPDILEGWNVEKVDAYISVQVKNEEKGKELIDMLKKKFLDEMNRGGSQTEKSMYSMIAKPLIEDYQGKKIYYVEAIPVPWIGKIGLAYAFVDDFFFIGLNRTTIHHVIDVAASGENPKKNLITPDTFPKGTFFTTLFDGINMSKELKGLYEKNKSALPRYFSSIFGSQTSIVPLVSSYYVTEDHNKRLGREGTKISYTIGSLSLSNTEAGLMVAIDGSKLTLLTGSTLETWEKVKKDTTFPQAILTPAGVSLDTFLSLPYLDDILTLNAILQLDSAFGGSESLLRNVIFGLNMGNDEIGFNVRIFREMSHPTVSSEVSSIQSSTVTLVSGIIGGIVLLLGVLGGFLWFRRNRQSMNQVSETPIVTQGDIPTQRATESQIIVTPPIVPESPIIVPPPVIPENPIIVPPPVQSVPEAFQESMIIVPPAPIPEVQADSPIIITTPESSVDTSVPTTEAQ